MGKTFSPLAFKKINHHKSHLRLTSVTFNNAPKSECEYLSNIHVEYLFNLKNDVQTAQLIIHHHSSVMLICITIWMSGRSWKAIVVVNLPGPATDHWKGNLFYTASTAMHYCAMTKAFDYFKR